MRLAYRFLLFLFISFAVTASICQAQSSASQTEVVGCLVRSPNGPLQLGIRPSGKTYPLTGNINLLQRHVNKLVAIPSSPSAGGDSLNVSTLRVVSESCTSALPSKNVAAVTGKVGRQVTAPTVTTTLSAAENTPGFQTESDLQQAAGTGASAPYVQNGQADSPYAPVNAEQAGQSEAAANANAAAAIRAEMYPGNTLGVTQKAMPPSSAQALKRDEQLPSPTNPQQQK